MFYSILSLALRLALYIALFIGGYYIIGLGYGYVGIAILSATTYNAMQYGYSTEL